MQKKQGISLIVLVITIIVMIILAASVVITLSNTGVIDRASEAVDLTNVKTETTQIELVQAELLAEGNGKIDINTYIDRLLNENLITNDIVTLPNGNKIVNTSNGNKLELSQSNATKIETNITTPTTCEHIYTELKNDTAVYSGELYCMSCGTMTAEGRTGIAHNGSIPNGGVYTSVDGNVYSAGDNFPEPQKGDEYTYDGYIYKLSYHIVPTEIDGIEAFDKSWGGNSTNGWGVKITDTTKTSYPEMLSQINGRSVENLRAVFGYCKNIETLPPLSVNATSLDQAFCYMKKLTTMPEIPYKVLNISTAFAGCTLLTNITNIPYGVTNAKSAFSGCTSLKTVPAIPASLTGIDYIFNNCANLEGIVTIHASPTTYGKAFKNTVKPIVLKGNSNNLELIAETATNSNVIVGK